MSPFPVVGTRAGFACARPGAVLAASSSAPSCCALVLTDGVTIEAARNVVERLEAEPRQEDDAALIKETRKNGHIPR